MDLNKAMIIGRLTRDPEIRTTTGGIKVASMGVATSFNWTDQSGQKKEQTEFHNIVAWAKIAEICGQYLVKGQEVYIEGRMQTRTWDAPDGAKRNRTEIVAENMQMGQKPKGFVATDNAEPVVTAAVPTNQPATPSTEEINVEEIPF